jgi:hypothetical protein
VNVRAEEHPRCCLAHSGARALRWQNERKVMWPRPLPGSRLRIACSRVFSSARMIQKEAARDSLAVVWCDLDVWWIPAEGRVRCVLSASRCACCFVGARRGSRRRSPTARRRAPCGCASLRVEFLSFNIAPLQGGGPSLTVRGAFALRGRTVRTGSRTTYEPDYDDTNWSRQRRGGGGAGRVPNIGRYRAVVRRGTVEPPRCAGGRCRPRSEEGKPKRG